MSSTRVRVPLFGAMIAVAGGILGLSQTASGETRYHVRPYYNINPGGLIDGLIENGATSAQQGFSDAARVGRVSADIDTGTLRAYNEINVPNSYVIALTEFSETFTVRGAAGTTFAFDFAVDGLIQADALSVPGNHYTYDAWANLAVFPAGVADWNTWYNLATTTDSELHFETFHYGEVNPTEDVDLPISELLSFSTIVPDGFEQYHVFARIQLAAVVNDSPQRVLMDFENTGALSFSAAPGAEVFSDSGVFPDTLPIPEPGSLALLIAGALTTVPRRYRPAR